MNSGFLITDAGLAVATAAAPGGPYIHIASFKVGSGVAYTPTRSQTGIQGTLLHEGVPQSYSIIDVDISQVTCVMDVTVGSWNFGEIGLYLEDGTLFAICVWDTLQEKIKAVGAQAGNIWKIKSLLKLAQAPAIVQVTLINSQGILEVPNWPLLASPIDQPNEANIAIVHDNDDNGNPVLVIRDSDQSWGPVAYSRLFEGSTSDVGASLTSTSFTNPGLIAIYLEVPSTTSKYLVKFPDGQIRKIHTKPTDDTIAWLAGITPSSGSISVWKSVSAINAIYWADTVEYNKLVNDFNPYWSTPSGVYSATNKGMNQTLIPNLARRTTTTDWLVLLNAIRTVSKTLNVNDTPISGFSDFTYYPEGVYHIGLETLRERWDATVAQVGLINSARNNVNLLYQSLTAYADQTDNVYWLGTKRQFFDFAYADVNTKQGMLNSGHALTVNPTVTSPTLTSWTNLQTALAAAGAITFGPTGVTAGAGWSPTGVGLQNLTITDQVLASFTAQHGWTVQVLGKTTGAFIRITFAMTNLTVGGSYSYTTPGVLHFAWASRKDSLLVNPVLPNPGIVYSSL